MQHVVVNGVRQAALAGRFGGAARPSKKLFWLMLVEG